MSTDRYARTSASSDSCIPKKHPALLGTSVEHSCFDSLCRALGPANGFRTKNDHHLGLHGGGENTPQFAKFWLLHMHVPPFTPSL